MKFPWFAVCIILAALGFVGSHTSALAQNEQLYDKKSDPSRNRKDGLNMLSHIRQLLREEYFDPNFKGKAVYGQKAIMALEGGTKFDGSFSGRAKHPQAVAAEQAGGAKAQYIVARANIDGFAPKES